MQFSLVEELKSDGRLSLDYIQQVMWFDGTTRRLNRLLLPLLLLLLLLYHVQYIYAYVVCAFLNDCRLMGDGDGDGMISTCDRHAGVKNEKMSIEDFIVELVVGGKNKTICFISWLFLQGLSVYR